MVPGSYRLPDQPAVFDPVGQGLFLVLTGGGMALPVPGSMDRPLVDFQDPILENQPGCIILPFQGEKVRVFPEMQVFPVSIEDLFDAVPDGWAVFCATWLLIYFL